MDLPIRGPWKGGPPIGLRWCGFKKCSFGGGSIQKKIADKGGMEGDRGRARVGIPAAIHNRDPHLVVRRQPSADEPENQFIKIKMKIWGSRGMPPAPGLCGKYQRSEEWVCPPPLRKGDCGGDLGTSSKLHPMPLFPRSFEAFAVFVIRKKRRKLNCTYTDMVFFALMTK